MQEVGGIAQAVVHETGMWRKGLVNVFFKFLKNVGGVWKIISKCFMTIPSAV